MSSGDDPVLTATGATVGAVDLPFYKRDRTSAPTVLCNGGLHFHGLMLMP